MSETIVVKHAIARVLDIVQELRMQGYVQGRDFDFAYHPPAFDNFSQWESAFTEFTFYDAPLASWFALKYS